MDNNSQKEYNNRNKNKRNNNRNDNRNDNRYNNRNDNRYDNRYDKRYERNQSVKEAEKNKIKEEAKKREINEENFPNLSSTTVCENNKLKSEYLEKIKQKKDEEKGNTILRDKRNWRGHVWIGPKWIKLDKYSDENEKKIKNYIINASQYASSILIPNRKKHYSRNQIDWYNSWEETFTEEEWKKMNEQLEREEQEDLNRRMNKAVEEIYQRNKSESERYYEETGELDDFAIAEIEHAEYEKWLEEFDKQYELEDNDDEDESDYIESDYDTDR